MSAAPKHTPGPWQVGSGVFGNGTILASGSIDTYAGVAIGIIARVEPTEQSDGEGRIWSAGGSSAANAKLIAASPSLLAALRPLAAIADAYDKNELDDEARRFWGTGIIRQNTTPPEQIELYTGRGGKRLLTLADCFAARDSIREAETS